MWFLAPAVNRINTCANQAAVQIPRFTVIQNFSEVHFSASEQAVDSGSSGIPEWL